MSWWARARVVLLIAVLIGMVPPAHAASGRTGRFEHVAVEQQQVLGEPRVVAAKDSDIAYALAIENPGGTTIWRSDDGGHTFGRPVQTEQGRPDADLAVDPADPMTIYVVDLFDPSSNATLPVSVSHDGGATFRAVALAPTAAGEAYDRPWIASPRPGEVVVAAHGPGDGATHIFEWISTDGGRTFTGPRDILPVPDLMNSSALVVGPTGELYFAYSTFEPSPYLLAEIYLVPFVYLPVYDIHYAVSADAQTWTTGLIATGQTNTMFPSMAVDQAANLYVAWAGHDNASGNDEVIELSVLRQGRSTWSAPRSLSSTTLDAAGRATRSVFPWVVAGRPGHVDVSYVGSQQPLVNTTASVSSPATTWDLEVARSDNAAAAAPTWSTVTAAAAFHTGSICTAGFACGPQSYGVANTPTPLDWREMDFIGSDLLASGGLAIPYGKDRPATSGQTSDALEPDVDLMLARETG